MEYDINTGITYNALELIDAGKLARSCPSQWWNRTLCAVNDSVVRLGVFEGEFHWHKHDREDELFFVLEGELLLDLPERTVALQPQQAMVVPRGVMHRTRADRRAVVLMVEAAGVHARGD